MSDSHDVRDPNSIRPALAVDGAAAADGLAALEASVQELQDGIDRRDADVYNRSFAADVLWGSPFGMTVRGYDELHPIHVRLQGEAAGGSASRYRVVQALVPDADVVIGHVRRDPVGGDGFAEMALYVLVRRDGTWWLAAGQNTPITPAGRPRQELTR